MAQGFFLSLRSGFAQATRAPAHPTLFRPRLRSAMLGVSALGVLGYYFWGILSGAAGGSPL